MKTDARPRQLAQIHLGKKQLGLDDDTYRDLLQAAGGKRSAADMDLAQRGAVIAHMISRGARLGFSARSGRNMSPLERKIRALWWQAHQAGVIRETSDRALRAWVKRQTGSADVAWLDKGAAAKCVEALKGMVARGRIEQGAN